MSNRSNNNGRTFETIVHACLNLSLVGGTDPSDIGSRAIKKEAAKLDLKFAQGNVDEGVMDSYCESAKKLACFLSNAIVKGSKVVNIRKYEDARSAHMLDPSDLGVEFCNGSVLGISCKVDHTATSHDRVSANQSSSTVVNWLDSQWVNTNQSTVRDFGNSINVLFDTFEKKAGVTANATWRELNQEMKYKLYTSITREVSSFLKTATQDSRNTEKLLRRIFGSCPYLKVEFSKGKKLIIQPILIDHPSAQKPIPLYTSARGISLKGVSLKQNTIISSLGTTDQLGKKLFEYLVIAGTTKKSPCWKWHGRLHNANTHYERSLKFDFRMFPENALASVFGEPLELSVQIKGNYLR